MAEHENVLKASGAGPSDKSSQQGTTGIPSVSISGKLQQAGVPKGPCFKQLVNTRPSRELLEPNGEEMFPELL